MLIRPAWLAILISLAAGGLGWGLPSVFLALHALVGRIAVAVEAVIGQTATGGTIITLLNVVCTGFVCFSRLATLPCWECGVQELFQRSSSRGPDAGDRGKLGGVSTQQLI